MKKISHCVLAVVASTALFAPIGAAQTQPAPTEATQLRPPTPGKQDSDSPVAMSMLFGLVIVALILTANLIASKRSHQD